jgi:hypothetical protein
LRAPYGVFRLDIRGVAARRDRNLYWLENLHAGPQEMEANEKKKPVVIGNPEGEGLSEGR